MKLLIKRIRKKKNIKVSEIAFKTGISKSALYIYEKGDRYPDMFQMEKIAKALDVKITELFLSEYKWLWNSTCVEFAPYVWHSLDTI